MVKDLLMLAIECTTVDHQTNMVLASSYTPQLPTMSWDAKQSQVEYLHPSEGNSIKCHHNTPTSDYSSGHQTRPAGRIRSVRSVYAALHK